MLLSHTLFEVTKLCRRRKLTKQPFVSALIGCSIYGDRPKNDVGTLDVEGDLTLR